MTTEGEGTQSGSEGTQSGAGDDNTNGAENKDGTGTSGSNDSSGVGLTAAEVAELRQRAESYQERMKAADRRAAEREAELKKLRDKDLPEQEKLVRDYAEAQKAVESLKTVNQQLSLKVAFLQDNSVTWHNPQSALKLVDMTDVKIDDDGTVSGLKEALTALAKSNPYLVKSAGEVQQEEKPQKPPATAPGTNGNSGTGAQGTKVLTTRFPGLNTRVNRS